MPKRKTYEIKHKILSVIKEKALSYTKIQTKLSTNYDSVKNNCEELEIYGFVRVSEIKEHPENGKPAYMVEITESGLEVLKRFERNLGRK